MIEKIYVATWSLGLRIQNHALTQRPDELMNKTKYVSGGRGRHWQSRKAASESPANS